MQAAKSVPRPASRCGAPGRAFRSLRETPQCNPSENLRNVRLGPAARRIAPQRRRIAPQGRRIDSQRRSVILQKTTETSDGDPPEVPFSISRKEFS